VAVGSEIELSHDGAAAVADYLESVRAGLCAVDSELAAETLDGVRAHLLERLEADSDADEVADVIGELGAPDEYAAALCRLLESPSESTTATDPQGTLLGVPYEMRPPTGERIASRWWSPTDERIFMPRIFGIGWDLNFGAIAVRLGFIEPDAEDEPFGTVSDRSFLLALMLPVALTAFVLGSFLAVRSELPVQLPVHWSWKGEPDRYAAAAWAFLLPFAMAAVPTAWAVWLVAMRRPPLVRAGGIALASLLASLGAGIWAITVATGLGRAPEGIVYIGAVLGSLLVPFALLTALARSGRAAEVSRDLRRNR
jgi:hypothetical protein